MATQLDIAKDPASTPTFITPLSDQRFAVLLAVDTISSIVVPLGARFAVIYYDTGKDVFVSDATLFLPITTTFVTTAGVLLKPSIDLRNPPIAELFFRCNEVAFVSVEFFT